MLVEQLKLGDWLLFPIVVGELAFLFLFQTHSQLNDVRALLDGDGWKTITAQRPVLQCVTKRCSGQKVECPP